MALTNTVTCDHRAGHYALLISLCVHVAVFLFLGMIVLNVAPKTRESVYVELVKATQQVRKLRRNIVEPPVRMMDRADLPKKSQDIVRPAIRQSDASIYTTAEVLPPPQYDYAEAKQPKLHDRMANHRGSLAISKVRISKPVVKIGIVHNPQERILKICKQSLDLSLRRPPAIPPNIESADPSILRDFLGTVSRKIEKSKRYPRWAMDASVEGRVVIRFTILQDGTLCEEILLVNSSGAEILDNAAISAVRNAAPFPALPEELRRERLQVELPMSFHMTRS